MHDHASASPVDLDAVRSRRERSREYRRARELLAGAIRVAPSDPDQAAVLLRHDGALAFLATPQLTALELKLAAWAVASGAMPAEGTASLVPWVFIRAAHRIGASYERDTGRRYAEFVDRVFLGLKAS